MIPQTSSEYLIVIEGSGGSFSAYAPDLPGCVAAAESLEACETLMREAIAGHVEVMREYGDPVPAPTIAGAAFVSAA
ncbi:MAG TPA: type II toxin-antitoxin system HicB family antitoxin [Actinomycetota bacterium]|nr:type II toxin-antitoxin system HicB family antitoxin [Actinomycetota bacterium]